MSIGVFVLLLPIYYVETLLSCLSVYLIPLLLL